MASSLSALKCFSYLVGFLTLTESLLEIIQFDVVTLVIGSALMILAFALLQSIRKGFRAWTVCYLCICPVLEITTITMAAVALGRNFESFMTEKDILLEKNLYFSCIGTGVAGLLGKIPVYFYYKEISHLPLNRE